MKLILPSLKPRNPLAAAGRRRLAGAHRVSASALRHQAQSDLRRELERLRPSP